MNIADIRKTYDVPAKAGMTAKIKTGDRAGESCVIIGADKQVDGYLKIRDKGGYRAKWQRRIHPQNLDYSDV